MGKAKYLCKGCHCGGLGVGLGECLWKPKARAQFLRHAMFHHFIWRLKLRIQTHLGVKLSSESGDDNA